MNNGPSKETIDSVKSACDGAHTLVENNALTRSFNCIEETNFELSSEEYFEAGWREGIRWHLEMELLLKGKK
jgi:hypothetical protein